jgi:hypothetical protein
MIFSRIVHGHGFEITQTTAKLRKPELSKAGRFPSRESKKATV